MDVSELRQRMSALPEPGGDSFWASKRRDLRWHVAHEDLSAFLNWSPITATMFVDEAPYIRDEYEALMAHDAGRWGVAIREHVAGSPKHLSFDGNTSGNLVHQAYHLMTWEIVTDRRVDELGCIVEIGGGYGAMAKVARAAGFSGDYLICDNPEFSLLQRYYLDQCGIEAGCFSVPIVDVWPGLLIALYSLSEMSTDEQAECLSGLILDRFLIAGNGIDPIMQVSGLLNGVHPQPVEIAHLPGSYYLIG